MTNETEVQGNRVEEGVTADDKLGITTGAKLTCAVCGAELEDKGKVEKNGLFYCTRPGCGYDWESEDPSLAVTNEFGATA